MWLHLHMENILFIFITAVFSTESELRLFYRDVYRRRLSILIHQLSGPEHQCPGQPYLHQRWVGIKIFTQHIVFSATIYSGSFFYLQVTRVRIKSSAIRKRPNCNCVPNRTSAGLLNPFLGSLRNYVFNLKRNLIVASE